MKADYQYIAGIIPAQAKVLDIGCSTGELLAHLAEEKQVKAHGIELLSERVAAAMAKGLSVVQGNADTDLLYYPDTCFDYVILGQAMQMMRGPRHVLEEALRIGAHVIVTIPNFGHMRNWLYLATHGRMPVTKSLPYAWYDTPNIHFCTIRDFVALAKELGCTIEDRVYLDAKGRVRSFKCSGALTANLHGELGIFVLKR